jgi:hypothetical protein
MTTDKTDPILQALSARVRYAAILIRKQDHAGALAVLEQCERVLPLPGKGNWLAAKDVTKRLNQIKAMEV